MSAAVDAFGAGLRTVTIVLLVIGVVVAVVGLVAGRRSRGGRPAVTAAAR